MRKMSASSVCKKAPPSHSCKLQTTKSGKWRRRCVAMLGERCSSRSSRSIASIAQIGRCSGGHKLLRLWQHLLERGEITRIVIRDRGLDLIGKRLRIGQGSLDTDEGPVQ